jgi:3-oxoadipate enol-lactonase
VAEWDRRLRGTSGAMYAAMALALLDQDDRLSRLHDLSVPTLVLVGAQDAPFLPDSRRLAGAIPGARLEVVPDAGHSPQRENAAAWRAALDSFLEGVL